MCSKHLIAFLPFAAAVPFWVRTTVSPFAAAAVVLSLWCSHFPLPPETFAAHDLVALSSRCPLRTRLSVMLRPLRSERSVNSGVSMACQSLRMFLHCSR
jgi:hypothetical protein